MLDEFLNLGNEAFDNSNKVDKGNDNNKGDENNNYNDHSNTEKNIIESKKHKIINTTPMRNDSLNLDLLTSVEQSENNNHILKHKGRKFKMAKQ